MGEDLSMDFSKSEETPLVLPQLDLKSNPFLATASWKSPVLFKSTIIVLKDHLSHISKKKAEIMPKRLTRHLWKKLYFRNVPKSPVSDLIT